MKRKVIPWTIEDIYKKRDQISFPDFQREPKLWNNRDKQLLIDSILRDIDIPKLYFHETENNTYEVIDGQQRLWAIWGFIDNEFIYESEDKQSELSKFNGKKFNEFPKELRDKIRDYDLQITTIKDATDEYLRKLFLRLQLGLLLVAGEKLHVSCGLMRDFVFKKMVKHSFVQAVRIPSRRFSKETLCAQICINSFSRKNIGEFARTRYEDLHSFFEDYKIIDEKEHKAFDERCKHIISVLAILNSYFKEKAEELKNRSFILSTYLFVEELNETRQVEAIIMPEFVKFIIKLLKRLRDEAKAGFERKNKELYIFESYLSNAPGEKYQIEKRHKKLQEFFSYFQEKNKIMGD
jgi:hypothetical protein